MILKNLKLSLRILLKQKGVTFINIFGLSISLACALFILLWVQHEMSYDRFHPEYRNLYRIEENQYYSSEEPYHVNVTPYPSGPVWKSEIPEITEQCRVSWSSGLLFNYQDAKYYEKGIVAVDSSFFQMFGFELLAGDPDNILNEPNTMVVTDETAEKYFGDEDPIGKSINIDNTELYTITGVVKKPPKNSIVRFNILLPWSFKEKSPYYTERWDSNSIFTYVKLQEGSIDTIVNRKLTQVTNKYKEGNTIDFMVAPMHRVHLHSYFGYGHSPGAIIYVYIFSAIALFVLIIACINFMNLSTAKSSIRAREIGLRKVNGASRRNLARQHFLESVLQTTISILLAFLLVMLFLNKFNDISGKDVTLQSLFSLRFFAGIIAVLAITSFLSGSYPALFLSSFNPISAIKDNQDARSGSGLLRKGLVIFQFSLSVLLISGSIIVSKQLNYMRNANLGFNKYHLINVPLRGSLNQSYETIKEEFQKLPGIEYVSATEQSAYNIGSNSGSVNWPGKDPEHSFLVSFTAADFNFIEAMGIQMKSGRGFSEEYPGDVFHDTIGNFVINATLANIIGKEDIIDMDFSFMGVHGKVVGVMEDYNYKPLGDEIEPLAILSVGSEHLRNMLIRLSPDNTTETLGLMEDTWNDMLPQYPFEYSFVDEEIDNMYRSEERMAKLLSIFMVVAIIIACLGLFALASFTAERRTREIGIRKTMGAMESQVTIMMIRDFSLYILISLFIAIPGIWFLAKWWLNEFYYRISLDASIFLFASAITIIVSVLTVTYHALKTARTNPVLALRYE